MKATLLTLIGAVLGAAVLYFQQSILPKQELGYRQNLINQTALAAQIRTLGLHGTLGVYIHRYADDERRRRALLGICLSIPAIAVGLAAVAYLLFQDRLFALFQPQDIPLLKQYALWLPLFVLLFTYQLLLEVFLVARMKVALTTAIREVGLRLLNLGLLFAFAADIISFGTLIGGTVLSYGVSLGMLLWLAVRTGEFRPRFRWAVFSKEEKRSLLHFTWYHALLGVSLNMLGYLDSIMLAPLASTGLEATAVYVYAVFIVSVLQIPYRSMATATYPILNQAYVQDEHGKVGDVFHRSSLNILVATLGIVLPVLVNLPSLPAYMKAGYEAVVWLVPILLIGRLVDAATGLNDNLLSVSRHYTFSFWLSLVLIGLIILFNALLIPRIGVFGAAWGTTIALVLYNAAKYFFVWHKMGMQPFSKRTVLVFICAAVAAVPGYFMLGLGSGIFAILLRCAVVVALYAGMLLTFRASPDVQTYWAGIRKSKRLF